MELSPITQNNSGMHQNPRHHAHAMGDDPDQDETPTDLYEALGYRKPVHPSITTQQWLEKRFIFEHIFG